jgi:restriction endonuclease S subunit
LKIKLSNISDIRFGYYAQPADAGVPYLQVRQFDEQGILRETATEFVQLDNKAKHHQLLDGDVLFVGKGSRLFAWCYRQSAGPYIASSIFFVLRPSTKIIHPEYLSAILNAPQSKAFFLQMGGGTNIFSIRKSELGAFEIRVPAMPEQIKIASLAALHQEEIELAKQLIEQKQNYYTAIISKLIK